MTEACRESSAGHCTRSPEALPSDPGVAPEASSSRDVLLVGTLLEGGITTAGGGICGTEVGLDGGDGSDSNGLVGKLVRQTIMQNTGPTAVLVLTSRRHRL